ncbi:MAG TPA: D-2-hydroxyacid dehydrogenase [Kouleothrix sp.]|nr:D-2-hydroxyacid dehydrogenase [Kouleothrix sp.]
MLHLQPNVLPTSIIGNAMSNEPRYTVLITTYLEPEHIERLRAVSPRLDVIYEPELIAAPRYPADHYNTIKRTPEQEDRWRELLKRADILFDFDPTHREDLPEVAPNLRWVQATSAGIGQFVRRMGYEQSMPGVVFTTASGVHAKPLAEFCVLAMLAFGKGLRRMIEDQRRKHWERYAGTDLDGRTLGIVGVGSIGTEVARLGQALGMTVIGTKRTVAGADLGALHLDALYTPDELAEVLRRAEFLVIVTPHTDETEKLISAAELALMPQGAVLINIGRGAVVDEPALIEALRSGQLGGAALDVFEHEPLPADSPLWSLQNVLVSPHSGSTSDRENSRLTELFSENLRRFLAGEPLLNILDIQALY